MKHTILLPMLALLALASPGRAAVTATVDPAHPGQTLEGWGTSLCWWANVVGGYPDAVRRDYLDKIFDPGLGLGLNIARYNIGGGENPQLPDTLTLRSRMPGFEPSDGVWDWTADANQRRVLFEAQKRGVNVVEAFSNSPPYWMTISGSVTGAANGGSNLKPEDYDKFAAYLAEVVKHYHDQWGVSFLTLDPMNESTTTYWRKGSKKQEGYHIDPKNAQNEDQNTLVKKVAAALKQRGLRTGVSASDDNGIGTTLSAVGSYDDEAKADLAQINTHTYSGGSRAQLGAMAQSLGKRMWVSEHGENDATGLAMSQDILADFKQLRCTAWVYWQVADGGGWGMLAKRLTDPTDYKYTLTEKYWVMAQYSKFIRPGFRFLDISDGNSLAAYQPATGTLVIVTTNKGPADAPITYDLSRFRRLPATADAYRTSPTESLAKLPPLPLAAGRITTTAKAASVTTYVLTKIY